MHHYNYRQDKLDAREIIEIRECGFCGEYDIISMDYLEDIISTAKQSEIGMARLMNIDHGGEDWHKRSLYFNEKGKYVESIELPTRWLGHWESFWYENDRRSWREEDIISVEGWKRVVRVLRSIDDHAVTLTDAIVGIMDEFSEQWGEGKITRAMVLISRLGRFGLFITYYDGTGESYIKKSDDLLLINFKKANHLIYREDDATSAIMKVFKGRLPDADKHRTFTAEWLSEHGYI